MRRNSGLAIQIEADAVGEGTPIRKSVDSWQLRLPPKKLLGMLTHELAVATQTIRRAT
jgi:hypothetical protein